MTDIRERRHHEFYFLLFTCTLALMLLVSADHLLSIYISLEVSSYSLYILVALRKNQSFGLEAGIKYFLVGSFSSAVMLFGMALLYSTSGTTYLTDMAKVLPGIIGRPGVVIGLSFMLGGFFFKLAVFPFHFWAPDTYQGAANQVAAYIATASKVAAIAVILRVLAFAGQGSVYLVHTLAILSVVSMTLGNLAAIVQKDLKRLLAFSTIAHAGYVLIGILVLSPCGVFGRHILRLGAPADGIHRFYGDRGTCCRWPQPADRRTGGAAPGARRSWHWPSWCRFSALPAFLLL